MQITQIQRDEDITHLVLAGRLDAAGVQEVDIKFSAYTAARRKSTLVDLSQVEFIASLGIGMLIASAKALQRHGAAMVLLSPQESVEKVLKTLGIDQVIPVVHDLESGLRRLGAGA